MGPFPFPIPVLFSIIAMRTSMSTGSQLTSTRSPVTLPSACATIEEWQTPQCQLTCSLGNLASRVPWCNEDCDELSELTTTASCSQYCMIPMFAALIPTCPTARPPLTAPPLPPDVTITSDVTYMQAYGKEFKLDIYSNTSVNVPQPLAVYIHGGGFIGGSKGSPYWPVEFVRHGFRVIDIDYPLCKDYWNGSQLLNWDATEPLGDRHPDCTSLITIALSNMTEGEQAARLEIANRATRKAIQYIHQHAAQHKIDTSKTVCNGPSAGAITCFETFWFNTSAIVDPLVVNALAPDPALDLIKINVATGRSGAINPAKAEYLQLPNTSSALAPGAGVWNIIGTNDTTVDPDDAVYMAEQLDLLDVPNVLILVPGAGHGVQRDAMENSDDMFEFIASRLDSINATGNNEDMSTLSSSTPSSTTGTGSTSTGLTSSASTIGQTGFDSSINGASDGNDSATIIAAVAVIGVVLLLGAVAAVVLFKRANRRASAAGQTRPAVENQMYSVPQKPANGYTPDHFC